MANVFINIRCFIYTHLKNFHRMPQYFHKEISNLSLNFSNYKIFSNLFLREVVVILSIELLDELIESSLTQ